MTDATKSLILEHLHAMRPSLAKLEENDTFMKARMSSLEQQVAGIHSDMATVHNRMDSMDKRLDRIERRLELTSV